MFSLLFFGFLALLLLHAFQELYISLLFLTTLVTPLTIDDLDLGIDDIEFTEPRRLVQRLLLLLELQRQLELVVGLLFIHSVLRVILI